MSKSVLKFLWFILLSAFLLLIGLSKSKGEKLQSSSNIQLNSEVPYQEANIAIVDSVPCVIITSSSLVTAFQPLADWKTRKGTKTEIKTTEQINAGYSGQDLADKIRAFIKDNYLNKKTIWVVLGGGLSTVPGRYAQMNDRSVLTDYYYSCLDGSWNLDGDSYYGEVEDSVDLNAEVYVGRIPLDSSTLITNFTSKLFSYERNSPYLNYQTKALFLSSKLEKDGDGARYSDSSAAHVPSWFSKVKLYEYISQQGIDSLKSGFGIVFNYSHAQNYNNFLSRYDVRDDINNTEIDSLNNRDKYSVFINSTCFDNILDSNCLSKHFIRNSAGGGVAYIGSTNFDQPARTQKMHSNILDEIFIRNNRNIGKALANAKTYLIPDSKTRNNGCRYTMFSYILLGDPQMEIWTDRPKFCWQEHPTSFYSGTTYTFNDTVKDLATLGGPLAGATVCLKGPGVYQIRTTNSSGIATFTVNFSGAGTASIFASKSGYIPDSSAISVANPPPPCCGGGCPYVYTWDGVKFVEDNTILTQSEFNFTSGSVTDLYQLTQPLVEKDGEYLLQLREFEKEETQLDEVELIAVDHPPTVGVGVTPEGKIMAYDKVLLPVSCIDNEGKDQLELIASRDSMLFESKGPGYLILTFHNPQNNKFSDHLRPISAPQPNRPPTPKRIAVNNRVTVETEDSEGNWHIFGDVVPRANIDKASWVLGSSDIQLGEQFRVKLSWNTSYETDWLDFYLPTEQIWHQESIKLKTAVHSKQGEITNKMAESDGNSARLVPGEGIYLKFPVASPKAEGMVRDFFFKAVGNYKKYDNVSNAGVISYKLHNNYPNPFNAQTEIQYALPEPSEVNLSVYNIMGQKVRTLVEGRQPAGVHKVLWDGKNEKGETVASGIYFYTLRTGTFTETKKMTLLK